MLLRFNGKTLTYLSRYFLLPFASVENAIRNLTSYRVTSKGNFLNNFQSAGSTNQQSEMLAFWKEHANN